MLSIVKLRVGQEAYQLTGVAQSLDDYYTGAGEAVGTWAGVGAERLGLSGEVNGDDLRAVLAGIAPGTGGLSPNGEEIRPHARRVPGFDLTFKAPKSLSVLYAVSDDPRVQGAIIEAGDAAVRATLGWLEREAIHVRRGTGNERFLANLALKDPDAAAAARIRTVPANGTVAAMFRHRTSRAGDPLLHWHTLVANLAEGCDGRWSAFVHPDLYQSVRAAGELFQTALRAEITARLGLEWRPGRHVHELAGVPQHLLEEFSKRTREIEDWLAATGTPDTYEGRQAAVLATRRNKPEAEGERFDIAWKAEALAAGWGPDAAEALLASAHLDGAEPDLDDLWRLPERAWDEHGTPYLHDRVVEADEWIAAMVRDDLTATDSTFNRAQLTRAVAARLGDGATVATVERVVARAIASPELIGVANPDRATWTSRELVTVEQRFLDSIHHTTGTRQPVDRGTIADVIDARPTLGTDQADAVRALLGTADGISVLVGPAGTGKTFTFEAIRAGLESSGMHVIGIAPSARAALELELGAGIASSTMHRLAARWLQPDSGPNHHTVLVIDEAGMAGTRDLEALTTAVLTAGGRIILSGDPHQLPEVTAGGTLAAAITHGSTVAELTVNRRQQQPWERAALAELRNGHVPVAVDAYRSHGRVVVAEDRAEMIGVAADQWIDAHADGVTPVLLAGTNQTVDALNRTVRHALLEGGLLDGDVIARFAGREFLVGDRVVLRRNSYDEHTIAGVEAAVLNGHAGTVLAGSADHLDIRLDRSHETIRLSEDYLHAGYVDHGYALTPHRAQGGTWDLAIAVGLDGLYREAAYVQMSRGSHANILVVTGQEATDIDAELARHDHGIPLPGDDPDDLDTELDRRLGQSRAKLLALSHDPDAQRVDTLARTVDLATLEQRALSARWAEAAATATVGADPTVVSARLEHARHTATQVALGQQVKPTDRHNIGIVTALDDDAGTVTVTFTSATGRQAVRDFGWQDLEIVTPRDAAPRPLTTEIEQRLDELTAPMRDLVDRWHHELARHDVAPAEAHRYGRAAGLAVDLAAAQLTATRPGWLTDMLGARPEAPAPARTWDDTVREIAAHRARNGIDDLTPGIGPMPDDPTRRPAWSQLADQVIEIRSWLDDHVPGERAVTPSRTAHELEFRRPALDELFATAPADQRDLITRLRDGNQLPFDNLDQLLRDALDGQSDRRDWILANWPHVVEYAEISRSLNESHTLEESASGSRPVLDLEM
jgi:conjugative relaxase-like TrwC/TraI family protein